MPLSFVAKWTMSGFVVPGNFRILICDLTHILASDDNSAQIQPDGAKVAVVARPTDLEAVAAMLTGRQQSAIIRSRYSCLIQLFLSDAFLDWALAKSFVLFWRNELHLCLGFEYGNLTARSPMLAPTPPPLRFYLRPLPCPLTVL